MHSRYYRVFLKIIILMIISFFSFAQVMVSYSQTSSQLISTKTEINNEFPNNNNFITNKQQNIINSPTTGNLNTSYDESKISSTNEVSANYTQGQIVDFWAQDLGEEQAGDSMSQYMYRISAEVLNITQNAYIFVDTNLTSFYMNNVGNSSLASQIGQEFETKIQPSDTQLGTPSDIDHNGKIIILIYPFIEPSSTTYTTGYFWPVNMYPPSTNPKNQFYYSEYKEIIYINDISI